MKGQRARLALVLCLALLMGVAASSAGAQSAVPIDIGTPGQVGSFVGTFTIGEFADQGGQVLARGIVTGILQTTSGPVSVVKTAALPVNALNDPNALASLLNELLAALAH